MFRLLSEHYLSNKFKYLMKKTESPKFETCNKIEAVQHILAECTKNESQRQLVLLIGLNLSRTDDTFFFNGYCPNQHGRLRIIPSTISRYICKFICL